MANWTRRFWAWFHNLCCLCGDEGFVGFDRHLHCRVKIGDEKTNVGCVANGGVQVVSKEGEIKGIARFEGVVEVIAAIAADFCIGQSNGP